MDFSNYKVDCKSTSGTCQFLRHLVISWPSKNQNSVTTSTTNVKYISAKSYCAQVLWIKQTLVDFGLNFDHIPFYYDNINAINLIKNPIQHSRTKHIEIRHYCIHDLMQKKKIRCSIL